MAKRREASGRRPVPARSPAAQLDRALETMMAATGAPRPRISPAIAALLSIASDLRDLPRAGFKERLAAGLAAREAQPSAMQARAPAPAQAETIQPRGAASSYRAEPHLFVRNAAGLMDFLKRAFDAHEVSCHKLPDGLIAHAEMRIGDSTIGIGDATGAAAPMPAMFHLHVDDPDAVYRRALAAGGVSLGEPADQPWGYRSAGVQDPGGNQWWINAPITSSVASGSGSGVSAAAPEGLNPVMPFMFIRAAAQAVEFYQQVFGARELMRETGPDGGVSHAQFQIGQSQFMISNPASQDVSEYAEKGWARTPQDLGGSPVHLYVQVPDVDSVFSKALAAGAKVVHPVDDMEWGDRVGGFEDPFGHVWYVATPLSAAGARRPADDQ